MAPTSSLLSSPPKAQVLCSTRGAAWVGPQGLWRLLLVALLGLLLSQGSSARPRTRAQAQAAVGKLLAALGGSGNYSMAAHLIARTGFKGKLVSYLQRPQNFQFTFLAPSNDAFAANLANLSLPCGNSTSPAITERFLRTVLALHLVIGRYNSDAISQQSNGKQFPTATPLVIYKLQSLPNVVGLNSGLTGQQYASAGFEKPELYRTKPFMVHGIDAVLPYPFQWTGF